MHCITTTQVLETLVPVRAHGRWSLHPQDLVNAERCSWAEVWPDVARRITYDEDTGQCLSDEAVDGMGNTYLYRKLPDGPRNLLVKFISRNRTEDRLSLSGSLEM